MTPAHPHAMLTSEGLSPEWIEAIRLILDELALAQERHKDGVIEVLLKDGKPVTVRATGARPIKISPKAE